MICLRLGLVILAQGDLRAQDYIFDQQHYGVENGLPHREVNAVCEDSRGFIWVGTKEGLCRFDGYTFQLFPAAQYGFLSDDFNRIYEAPDGFLWLLTGKQADDFDIWNPGTGAHTTFRQKFGADSKRYLPFFSDIFSCQDKTGNIYLQDTAQAVVWKFHPDSGLKPIRFSVPGGKLLMVENGHLWITDRDRPFVHQMNDAGQIIHSEKLAGKAEKIYPFIACTEPYFFYATHPGSSDRFTYYSIRKGKVERLFDVAGKGHYYHPITLFPPQDTGFLLLDQGRIYGPNGAMLLDIKNATTEPVNIHERIIYTDHQGRIWFGNSFGLRVLSVRRNRFSSFLDREPGVVLGLNAVRGINSLHGILYSNLEKKGLFRIDPAQGTANRIFQDANGATIYTAVIALKNGNIALACNHFLYIVSPAGQPILLNRVMSANIWSFSERPDGKLWLGTEKGLSSYDPTSDTETSYLDKAGFGELSNAFIYNILESDSETLMLCTSEGFFVTNTEKGVLQRFWQNGQGRFKLPAEIVYHLYQDTDHTLWLATNKGLIHLDLNAKQDKDVLLQHITKAEGLSNNVLYAVYPDEAGNLWLPSDYGIIRFNKETGQVKTYLQEDGLSNNEFNRIAHFQGPDGRLYFGTIDGLTTFHPKDLSDQGVAQNYPMVVTRYQQFDGQQNKMTDRSLELWQSEGILLQPDDRFFQIDFALLNFQHANQNYYAYRIEGVDNEWNYLKDHTLRFGSLPYGRHTLRIKGQDDTGRWSEKELRIPLQVLKPFYLKSWFLLMVGVLLLAMIAGYLRYRTFHLQQRNLLLEKRVQDRTVTIEKQAEELRTLDKLKSRFFANVSHELRTPLTLMLGPVSTALRDPLLGEKNTALLKSARQSGNKLLALINEILDLSKLESGRMSLHESATDLDKLLRHTEHLFESHAHFKGIRLLLDNSIPSGTWILVDKKKLEHVIFNLLSNALKFTERAGTITLFCRQEQQNIVIGVQDTGRGIHSEDLPYIFERFYQGKYGALAAEGGTGIGLSLCKELAELMGGKLEVESTAGEGSVFHFIFPQKTAAQPAEEKEDDPEDYEEASLLHLITERQPDAARLQRILVVEDNPGLQQFLTLILQDKFEVQTAGNGVEALNRLSETRLPDLIISDVMMPQMDGFQLLEHLKSNDRYRHLPVIMLTARAELTDKLYALRVGVDDYMLKPFDEEELMARVENLLKFAQLRFGIYRKNTVERGQANSVADTQTKAPAPAPRLLSAEDVQWLKQLEENIKTNIEHPHLSVEFLATQMIVSARHLQRQIKAISGLNINQYIQEARLQRSRQLLERGGILVKQVSAKVGYKDVKHFARLYKERFGKLPSLEE